MKNNKDQIIFVISHDIFWPLKGGGGVRVYWVVNSLIKKIKNIKIIAPFSTYEGSGFEKLKIFSLGKADRFNKNKEFRYVIQMFQIFFILLFNKFDVIYAHNIVAALPSLLIAKLKRKKLVFDMDDILTGLSGSKIVRKIGESIEFFVARNADVTIAMSNALKNELEKHGAKNVVKIFHGVDIERFKQYRERKILANKKIINLVYMGGIEKHDGAILIPSAIKMVITKYKKVHVNILGQGSQLELLKNKVKKLKLDKYFTFFPWMEQKKTPEFLSNQDIGLVTHFKTPATDICLVLKGLEYMACGLPVIAPDLLGMKEEIGDNERGVLFKTGNYKDLANEILFLINNQKQWPKIRSNANKFINKNANWQKNANNITQTCIKI